MTDMDLENYLKQELAWRQGRDDFYRMENSWLALAGLFWLQEGDNKVGSGAQNTVVLPASAPDWLGIIVKNGAQIRFVGIAPDVSVDGDVTMDAELRPDMKGTPSVIRVGDISMIIIQRGDAYAVRVWDNTRPERQSYLGRQWYTVDEAYRIQARYERFKAPEQMTVETTVGSELAVTASGMVHFDLHGASHSLVVSESVVHGLSISFRDETNGDGSYGAGRYLMTELPDGENVVLDFNRSYSPPCAVTAFATCPLPPAQNRLPIRIEAGERH